MSRASRGDSDADGASPLVVLVEVFCPFSRIIALLFAIALVLAMSAGLFVAILDPGEARYFVSLFALVIDVTVVIVLGSMLYLCRKRYLVD